MDMRDEFLSLMERMAPQQGLSPIAARIVGVLLYDGKDLSFSELAEELKVSRGSISTNTRTLMAYHVIERIKRPGERQDFFRVTPQLFPHLLTQWSSSMAEWATEMRRLSGRMGGDDIQPRGRVESFAVLYETLAKSMEDTARQMARRAD